MHDTCFPDNIFDTSDWSKKMGVCMCVCAWERERERKREREKEDGLLVAWQTWYQLHDISYDINYMICHMQDIIVLLIADACHEVVLISNGSCVNSRCNLWRMTWEQIYWHDRRWDNMTTADIDPTPSSPASCQKLLCQLSYMSALVFEAVSYSCLRP